MLAHVYPQVKGPELKYISLVAHCQLLKSVQKRNVRTVGKKRREGDPVLFCSSGELGTVLALSTAMLSRTVYLGSLVVLLDGVHVQHVQQVGISVVAHLAVAGRSLRSWWAAGAWLS